MYNYSQVHESSDCYEAHDLLFHLFSGQEHGISSGHNPLDGSNHK